MKCLRSLCGFVMAVSIALAVWYLLQDESRQRAVRNLVRQIPDLPARYSV